MQCQFIDTSGLKHRKCMSKDVPKKFLLSVFTEVQRTIVDIQLFKRSYPFY